MKKVYPQFYGTIKHVGGHNKFSLDNPISWEKYLDVSLKTGQRITIALKPYYKPRTTGSAQDIEDGKGNQNGYYWKVVLPIVAEELGLDIMDAHKEVQLYFLPQPSRLNPNQIIGGSTSNLNRLEWEDFMERVRTYFLVEKGIKIPLPHEAIDDGDEDSAPIVEDTPDPINPLIELFKDVNPSYARIYANKTQRAAMERLLNQHGQEKLEKVIKFLPVSNASKYAPTITNPLELEQNLGKLLAWGQKQKAAQRKTGGLDHKKEE